MRVTKLTRQQLDSIIDCAEDDLATLRSLCDCGCECCKAREQDLSYWRWLRDGGEQ